jgi:hypothetical protein
MYVPAENGQSTQISLHAFIVKGTLGEMLQEVIVPSKNGMV